jgi:hypothetical protein
MNSAVRLSKLLYEPREIQQVEALGDRWRSIMHRWLQELWQPSITYQESLLREAISNEESIELTWIFRFCELHYPIYLKLQLHRAAKYAPHRCRMTDCQNDICFNSRRPGTCLMQARYSAQRSAVRAARHELLYLKTLPPNDSSIKP